MTRRPWVIVPAAGSGQRMQADRPKQYLPLAGSHVLALTIERLLCLQPQALVLVLAADDPYRYHDTAAPLIYAQGGAERCHSVWAGLQALSGRAQDDDIVLVHDAARPCVRVRDLIALWQIVGDEPNGALLAAPVRDTMKKADADGHITATVSRERLWHALTPQGFRYADLCAVLEQTLTAGQLPGDEASAFEWLGRAPRLLAGAPDNIKITYPEDHALAAAILRAQQENGA